jgi:hypothetical protein
MYIQVVLSGLPRHCINLKVTPPAVTQGSARRGRRALAPIIIISDDLVGGGAAVSFSKLSNVSQH